MVGEGGPERVDSAAPRSLTHEVWPVWPVSGEDCVWYTLQPVGHHKWAQSLWEPTQVLKNTCWSNNSPPKPSRSLTTPANDQVGDCGPKLIPTPKHLFVFRAVVDTGLPVSAHKCCIHDCDAAGDGFDIQMAGSLHMAVAYGAFPSHLGWTVICLCSMECTEASTCQV